MPAINAKIVAWWEEAPSYIKLYTISNNTPTSTITNLTNTTWYFNEDLTNTTANAEYDITFNSNNTTYEQLITVSDTYIVYNPDTVYYGGQKWFNENFRTIEITGGTDITITDLKNSSVEKVTEEVKNLGYTVIESSSDDSAYYVKITDTLDKEGVNKVNNLLESKYNAKTDISVVSLIDLFSQNTHLTLFLYKTFQPVLILLMSTPLKRICLSVSCYSPFI